MCHKPLSLIVAEARGLIAVRDRRWHTHGRIPVCDHASEPPVPLEDAIRNMTVIEAAFRSAESGTWERPAV